MFDVGRICVKIAGRDAGKKCVVVEQAGEGMVVIDGQTRRRKCNVRHLEPTQSTVELKSGASHDEVKAALEKVSIDVRQTKPKQAGARPVKQKAKKEAPAKKEKPAKKAAAKEEPKVEKKEQPAEKPKEAPKATENAPKAEAPKAEEKPAAEPAPEKKE